MTAPLLSASPETTSFGPVLSPRSLAGNGLASSRRPVNKVSTHQRFCNAAKPQSTESVELDAIWSSLLESLHPSVIVVSRQLKPIYWNGRSKNLCQALLGGQRLPSELPIEVVEVCHRLMRDSRITDRPLIMECQAVGGDTLRISARWLQINSGSSSSTAPHLAKFEETSNSVSGSAQPPYMLITLENCTDTLREELRLEQQKYDLTEREAEVWMLLRQEYTYQEIAKMLQISLNTVKTHVKNVYAKKRSCQGRDKFWYCN